jgi:hypothetical protein
MVTSMRMITTTKGEAVEGDSQKEIELITFTSSTVQQVEIMGKGKGKCKTCGEPLNTRARHAWHCDNEDWKDGKPCPQYVPPGQIGSHRFIE